MRKQIFIAFLLLLALSLSAHPASSVDLSYDGKTQLLTVSFDHTVKNPADHFISSILIKVGGKDVISQSLSAQDSAAGGSVVYKLNGIKAGTVIEAVSTCNKIGKKSTKLTVK
jgi:hypothetical protein